jgi:hypothetical protein
MKKKCYNTGGYALQGLQQGAGLGSTFGSVIPGLGTVAGGLIGGALGAGVGAITGMKKGNEEEEQMSEIQRQQLMAAQNQAALSFQNNMMRNNFQGKTYQGGGGIPIDEYQQATYGDVIRQGLLARQDLPEGFANENSSTPSSFTSNQYSAYNAGMRSQNDIMSFQGNVNMNPQQTPAQYQGNVDVNYGTPFYGMQNLKQPNTQQSTTQQSSQPKPTPKGTPAQRFKAATGLSWNEAKKYKKQLGYGDTAMDNLSFVSGIENGDYTIEDGKIIDNFQYKTPQQQQFQQGQQQAAGQNDLNLDTRDLGIDVPQAQNAQPMGIPNPTFEVNKRRYMPTDDGMQIQTRGGNYVPTESLRGGFRNMRNRGASYMPEQVDPTYLGLNKPNPKISTYGDRQYRHNPDGTTDIQMRSGQYQPVESLRGGIRNMPNQGLHSGAQQPMPQEVPNQSQGYIQQGNRSYRTNPQTGDTEIQLRNGQWVSVESLRGGIRNVPNQGAGSGFASGGSLVQYNGPKHEQGGINIGNGNEVEGGETRHKDYIFSDRIIADPKTKKTFADVSKKLNKMYEGKDSITMSTREAALNALRYKQEEFRAGVTETMMGYGGQLRYAGGGKIKYEGGGGFQSYDINNYSIEAPMIRGRMNQRSRPGLGVNLDSSQPQYLGQQNTQAFVAPQLQGPGIYKGNIPSLGVSMNTTPFLKNGIGEAYSPNSYVGYNIPRGPMSKQLPAGRTGATGNGQWVGDALKWTGDKVKGFAQNVGLTGTSLGTTALTNMGALYDIYRGLRGPDDVNLERVTPNVASYERIDPTTGRRNIQEQGRIGRENVRMAGNRGVGNYMANSANVMGNTQRAIGQYEAQVGAQNAQIGNQEAQARQQALAQANMVNTQLANQEMDLRQQEKDAAQNTLQHGLTELSEGMGTTLKDAASIKAFRNLSPDMQQAWKTFMDSMVG